MTTAAGALALTLADIAKLQDPKGNIAQVIEILATEDGVLDDMLFMEGNLPTGHRTTIRSGMPAGTWRKLNYGVQPEKATTVQVDDTCGMLESYAEVDAKILSLSGNPGAVRLSEDRAFIMGLRKTMASALIYGDTTITAEKIMGLTPRFNDLSGPENASNILDGGGTGSDNTSIWLVGWGDNTVHGIYPKGSKAGLSSKDLGQVTKVLADGSMYEVFRTHYTWDTGLTVRDWRYIVRIANIDVSDLVAANVASADLIDLMAQAVELLPDQSLGRPVFYCNRTVRTVLRRQIASKVAQSTLTMDAVGGKRVIGFDGIPVRRIDSILNNESRVV